MVKRHMTEREKDDRGGRKTERGGRKTWRVERKRYSEEGEKHDDGEGQMARREIDRWREGR